MAKKKKQKKAKEAKAAPQEIFVVVSRVKEHIKAQGYRVSGEFADGLNAKVYELVTAAIQRCVENGRQTVRAFDA